MPVKVECPSCKKLFLSSRSMAERNRFCSNVCCGKKSLKYEVKPCLNCKEYFKPVKESIMFCSVKCFHANTNPEISKNCEYCGILFFPTQNKVKAKFCNKKCAGLSLSKRTESVCTVCSKHFFKLPCTEDQQCCSNECWNRKRERVSLVKGEYFRVCGKCSNTKPFSEFQKASRRKYKITGTCIVCRKKAESERRRKSGMQEKKVVLKPNKCILKSLFLEQNLSIKEIAAKFNTNPTTAARWLEIDKLHTPAQRIEIPNKEILEKLRFTEFKTSEEIASVFGVCLNTVGRWYKKYSFEQPTRKPSKLYLEKLYLNEEKTFNEIGEIFGVRGNTARTWALSYGIPVRPSSWKATYKTSGGDFVRSSYEKAVASWLYSKGIPYEYEPRLKVGNFKADFLSKGFYIEVWGIENDATYTRRKAAKKEIYKKKNLPLIEIDAFDFTKASQQAWKRKLEILLN